MRMLAAALFAAFAVAAIVASPQDEKKKKNDANLIVVEGCVNGSRLDVTAIDNGGSSTEHFTLRGNKDTMKTLTKDLKGHLVKITGTMDDPAGKHGMGKTIPIDKHSTITINERQTRSVLDPATDPVITVDSFIDINPHCTGR